MTNRKPKVLSGSNTEIATKIAYLFDNYRNVDGERYTYLDVERLTNGAIDNSWLSKLSHGRVTRPGLDILKTITNFFNISPDFWFKDLDQWIEEQKGKSEQAFRETVVTRTQDLPLEVQQIIFDLIEVYKKRMDKKASQNDEE